MSTRDSTDEDDILTGPVPLPDDEPTPAELAHARAFASLVDKALSGPAGGRAPAAMSTDDRALLEVATVIRATSGGLELPAARTSALVEDALRQAIGGVAPTRARQVVAETPAAVIPIGGRRRWLPWSISAASIAVAAAAVALLAVRTPRTVTPAPRAASLPTSWMSRPSDAVVGPIAREHAGDAEARIDAIFADRLDGFRERTYAGGRP